MQYDDPMPRLGFDTYVFVERIAANAAALHPFPEHHVGLVREALADAGLEVSVLGPGAPEVGEVTASTAGTYSSTSRLSPTVRTAFSGQGVAP